MELNLAYEHTPSVTPGSGSRALNSESSISDPANLYFDERTFGPVHRIEQARARNIVPESREALSECLH